MVLLEPAAPPVANAPHSYLDSALVRSNSIGFMEGMDAATRLLPVSTDHPLFLVPLTPWPFACSRVCCGLCLTSIDVFFWVCLLVVFVAGFVDGQGNYCLFVVSVAGYRGDESLPAGDYQQLTEWFDSVIISSCNIIRNTNDTCGSGSHSSCQPMEKKRHPDT